MGAEMRENAEEFEWVCESCGEECIPTIVDQGIGPFEFWGAKYNDSHPACVSNCCESTVLHYGYEYTYRDYCYDNEPGED